jgi:hypothetical protein
MKNLSAKRALGSSRDCQAQVETAGSSRDCQGSSGDCQCPTPAPMQPWQDTVLR